MSEATGAGRAACPWCSESVAADARSCPACGAALAPADAAEPELPGVTSVVGADRPRRRPRRGLLGLLLGGMESEDEDGRSRR